MLNHQWKLFMFCVDPYCRWSNWSWWKYDYCVVSKPGMEIRAMISNYTYRFLWDVITYPCHHSNLWILWMLTRHRLGGHRARVSPNKAPWLGTNSVCYLTAQMCLSITVYHGLQLSRLSAGLCQYEKVINNYHDIMCYAHEIHILSVNSWYIMFLGI